MPSLYNCRHDGDHYRITKFDHDWNVEASYLCTETECDCPAGHRPSCRHRQMLPKFLHRGYVGTEFFFDHDRGGWVQGASIEVEVAEPAQQMVVELKTFDEISHEHDEEQLAFYREAAGLGQASEQQPSTSSPLPLEPHSQTVTTADFESVGDGSSPSVAAKGTIRRRV